MPHAPSLVQSPSGQPFPLVRIKPSGCVVRQRVLLPDRIHGRAYGPTRASRRAGSERVQHPPTSSLSGASAKPFLLRCPASRSGRPSSRRSRWAIRRSSRQPRSGVPDAVKGEVVVVADLPRTRSGKIMRRVARAARLGLDPGDLSRLENPGAVVAIAEAGPARHGHAARAPGSPSADDPPSGLPRRHTTGDRARSRGATAAPREGTERR